MASLGIPLFVDDGIGAVDLQRSGTARGRCLLAHCARKRIECHGKAWDPGIHVGITMRNMINHPLSMVI